MNENTINLFALGKKFDGRKKLLQSDARQDTIVDRKKEVIMESLGSWRYEELPRPTKDLVQAQSDLGRWGYCLLEDAISPALLIQCRNRLTEQAAGEKARGFAFEDGGPQQQWGDFTDEDGRVRPEAFRAENGGVNQRVWMLANKGQAFLDVLEEEKILGMVGHVLGERFILHSYTANIARPGGVAMPLHIDQWWAPEPTARGAKHLPVGSFSRNRFSYEGPSDGWPDMLAPPAVSNVLIMLDGMSAENGGTRIVPGSHLAGRHPDAELDRDVETIAAEGPPGCAIITDGRVWHGTGANLSNADRRAILITFCGPQFRPQENYTLGARAEILENASDRLLELLGFRVWCGYGRTGDPTTDFVSPEDTLIGELTPD